MQKTKVLMTYFMFVLLSPEAMRGNNFKEKKVIFMQFWIRSHLNKLDWLTPQDVYYEAYLIFEAVNFWGFWGPEAMRGNNFKEKKVVPLTFPQFWVTSHLNKLDWLTPQDVYCVPFCIWFYCTRNKGLRPLILNWGGLVCAPPSKGSVHMLFLPIYFATI